MTQLLVSVRSAAEAEAALAGGAHVIDVKEPSRGSLGRADDATIAEVVRVVAGRRPVSAALGELANFDEWPECIPQLQFVKWGLSEVRPDQLAAGMAPWTLAKCLNKRNPRCEAVAVAYADAPRAHAPSVEDVVEFVIAAKQRVLLIDTFQKDGIKLLDWLDVSLLEQLITRCRHVGIRVALAGSLGFDDISALKHLQPDWFAVRGAACRGQRRDAMVDASRVRGLVALLAERLSND